MKWTKVLFLKHDIFIGAGVVLDLVFIFLVGTVIVVFIEVERVLVTESALWCGQTADRLQHDLPREVTTQQWHQLVLVDHLDLLGVILLREKQFDLVHEVYAVLDSLVQYWKFTQEYILALHQEVEVFLGSFYWTIASAI